METTAIVDLRFREVVPMSMDLAREQLRRCGLEDKIKTLSVSSATVELAAQALGCEESRIAKTLSFDQNGDSVLVVAAGDAKIDNAKYKTCFGCKARMLPADEVEMRVGHAVGGVCPFGVREGVKIYLDVSLQRFATVYPACGTSASAVELTLDELEKASGSLGWIDVCKGWNDND